MIPSHSTCLLRLKRATARKIREIQSGKFFTAEELRARSKKK
jgi:hypothetical protein